METTVLIEIYRKGEYFVLEIAGKVIIEGSYDYCCQHLQRLAQLN